MSFILQSLQLYLVILAGWINREQQDVIEYLRTENAVLKEKLGKKRILGITNWDMLLFATYLLFEFPRHCFRKYAPAVMPAI